MICELVNWIVSNAKFVRWQTKDNAKARITIENNDHYIQSTAYGNAKMYAGFFFYFFYQSHVKFVTILVYKAFK